MAEEARTIGLSVKPDISLIIRCYNEEQHIGRLLSGILQQSIQNIEIIVVDSGSIDATRAIASRYPVKLLSIDPKEFSFGRALNLGCQAARGEFIVIVSAHVYPLYEDWLEELLRPFSEPEVALTYGKQRGNETTKYSEHQVFATWFPDSGERKYQDHPFCNNANAAIRRTLWEKYPYNEELTGLEDLDWANRLITLGYRVAYVPEAEVVHVHEETSNHIYNRYRREAIALNRIFPQEKFTLWDFLRLLTGNVFTDCYHAASEGVLLKNLWSVASFRLMQFWGTYRGFTQRGLTSIQLRQTFYYPREYPRVVKHDSHDGKRRNRIDYTGENQAQKQQE